MDILNKYIKDEIHEALRSMQNFLTEDIKIYILYFHIHKYKIVTEIKHHNNTNKHQHNNKRTHKGPDKDGVVCQQARIHHGDLRQEP